MKLRIPSLLLVALLTLLVALSVTSLVSATTNSYGSANEQDTYWRNLGCPLVGITTITNVEEYEKDHGDFKDYCSVNYVDSCTSSFRVTNPLSNITSMFYTFSGPNASNAANYFTTQAPIGAYWQKDPRAVHLPCYTETRYTNQSLSPLAKNMSSTEQDTIFFGEKFAELSGARAMCGYYYCYVGYWPDFAPAPEQSCTETWQFLIPDALVVPPSMRRDEPIEHLLNFTTDNATWVYDNFRIGNVTAGKIPPPWPEYLASQTVTLAGVFNSSSSSQLDNNPPAMADALYTALKIPHRDRGSCDAFQPLATSCTYNVDISVSWPNASLISIEVRTRARVHWSMHGKGLAQELVNFLDLSSLGIVGRLWSVSDPNITGAPAPPSGGDDGGNGTKEEIGAIVGGVCGVLGVLLIVAYFYNRNQMQNRPKNSEMGYQEVGNNNDGRV